MEFLICNLNFNCYLYIYTCSLFRKKKMTARIPRLFLLQNKLQLIIQNEKRNIHVFLILFIYLDILEPSQRRFIDFGTTRANQGPRQKSPTLRLKSPARSLRFWCRRRVAVRRSRISRSYVMLAVLQMYNKIKV